MILKKKTIGAPFAPFTPQNQEGRGVVSACPGQPFHNPCRTGGPADRRGDRGVVPFNMHQGCSEPKFDSPSWVPQVDRVLQLIHLSGHPGLLRNSPGLPATHLTRPLTRANGPDRGPEGRWWRHEGRRRQAAQGRQWRRLGGAAGTHAGHMLWPMRQKTTPKCTDVMC